MVFFSGNTGTLRFRRVEDQGRKGNCLKTMIIHRIRSENFLDRFQTTYDQGDRIRITLAQSLRSHLNKAFEVFTQCHAHDWMHHLRKM